MANRYVVKYLTHQERLAVVRPEGVKAEIEAWLASINQQMSVFRKDSDISRFNALKAGQALVIAPEFARVLREAQRLHQETEGGLDITLAPLIDAWGYGVHSASDVPDACILAHLRAAVGMEKFSLESSDGQHVLLKHDSDMRLDVSAIAKGYAVDGIAKILDDLGIDNYLVDIGGEMRARGVNAQARPWRVAVENPVQAAQSVVVSLDNQCIATSGNYRHCRRDASGRLVHHVISPVSLAPTAADVLSVSVIADSVMRADGLATGLYTLGIKRALALADAHQWAICFLIMGARNQVECHCSAAFLPFLMEEML